jgi:hypothetical protein
MEKVLIVKTLNGLFFYKFDEHKEEFVKLDISSNDCYFNKFIEMTSEVKFDVKTMINDRSYWPYINDLISQLEKIQNITITDYSLRYW